MRLTLLLSTILLASSCGPFRQAKAPLPPPTPMPARIPDQVSNTEPAPPPKNLPPPPAIANHPDTRPAPTAQMSIPATPTAPPPRPVKKKQAQRPAPSPPPVAASAETVVEPSAPPAYRLGQLRTPEQRDRLRKQTEDLIGVCSAALSAAEGRQLTPMQTEMVNRVRGFSQQARDTLEKDPGEARNFASKGKTFAEALLAELKK